MTREGVITAATSKVNVSRHTPVKISRRYAE
jgi:hypothetical protein